MWYQWLCECKNDFIISWPIFTEELISYYEDIKSNSFFSQLISIRQKGTVVEHIQQLQKLKNILDSNLLDLFMETLEENIQLEVRLLEQESLENAFRVARKVESKNMATRRATANTYKQHNVSFPNPTQPTRLTPQ